MARVLMLVTILGYCSQFVLAAHSQGLSLHLTKTALKDVFVLVEQQSDYRFLYTTEEVSGIEVKRISINDASVDQLMTQCLEGTGLAYVKDGNLIIVRKETARPEEQTPPPVQSPYEVRGQISDASGGPVIGATIRIVGTHTGTNTDAAGNYRIQVPNGQVVFEVSCVGMEPIQIHVSGRSEVNLSLREATHGVEEVVVTGYQTLSRRESASAVSTVKAEDIYLGGFNTIDKMLQGQIPGMIVMNTSGEPSATPKIRIRGNSTISGNKAPVWVVDGVIYEQSVPFTASDLNSEDAQYLIGNAIAGINPQDIETITVLKDASATAIYGVKAANGVIVITTKKGQAGKPRIAYTGNLLVNTRPHYDNFDLMNSQQRMQLSREIMDAGLQYSRYPTGLDTYEGLAQALYMRQIDQPEFNSRVKAMETLNMDWFGELFRNTVTHSHDFNISGGTENVRYYFSGGYNNNQGAAKGSESERFTSLAKLDVRLNNRIDFQVQMNYSTTKNSGYHSSVNPFKLAYDYARTIPAYEEDGSYHYLLETYQTTTYNYNILEEMKNTGQSARNNDYNGQFNLNIKLFDGLKYRGTASLHSSTSNSRNWATALSYHVAKIRRYNYEEYQEGSDKYDSSPLPYGGVLGMSHISKKGYTVRNALEYAKTFNYDHEINAMAGSEIRSNRYQGTTQTGYGWNPDFGEVFMPVYTNSFVSDYVNTGYLLPSITNNINQVASFFGTASYVYKNRYVLNGNIRSDGSNKFGSNPDYRWLPTWSVAGKWIISNENFMQNTHWINHLSIRASYGVQGNIHDDSTPNLITQLGGRDEASQLIYHTIYRVPNPDLRWEKTHSWNAAVDFTLFNNRVKGQFDVYKKRTSDLIIGKDVPTSTGRSVLYMNAGEMDNFGFEGFLNVDILRSRKFDWRVNVNFGRDVNEVTLANSKLYSALEEVNLRLSGEFISEGDALGSMYSYRFAGISEENGLPLFYAKDGRKVHFGDRTAMELVNCGSIFPDLAGGFDTQLVFNKSLSLTLGFTYSFGAVKRLPNLYRGTGMLDPLKNVTTEVMDRWKQPGDRTDIPAVYDSKYISSIYSASSDLVARDPDVTNRETVVRYPYELYNYSDIRTEKSDYLRLRLVALSYILPQKFVNKIGISSAQVRLQGTDLHVWTSKKWRGLDPETPQASIPVLPAYNLCINLVF